MDEPYEKLRPKQIIARLEARLRLVRLLDAEPLDILILEERLSDARQWLAIQEQRIADEEARQRLSPSREPEPFERWQSLPLSEVQEHIERAKRRAERRLRAMQSRRE